jgi:transposase
MNDVATVELPDDPTLLKRIIRQRDALIVQRDAVIGQRDSALALCDLHIEQIKREAAAALGERDGQIQQIKQEAAQQLEAMQLRHKAEMDALLRRFYGPRSEKFDPTELLLFGQSIAEQTPVDEKVVEAESGQKLSTRRINHKHGRRRLPENLPRIPIPHDLSDEQKTCPCCGKERTCIGSETTEQLEYVPASFKVLQHVQYKYACSACDAAGDGAQIQLAAKPDQPIDKGLAGPGLLAYVIVSKLADHLPLYRLENIFDRQGLSIARSTMCAWMLSASLLVKPLVELMIDRVKQSKSIHTDDTRVPVRAEGKCRSGRIWTYIGDGSNPYLVFDYTPDHTRAGPHKFLADYKGYLQADAFSGYDGIYVKGSVIEVACWAHARRKFFDAKDTDARRAAEMLAMVGRLYAIEHTGKILVPEARQALRQQRSVVVLQQIKAWLDTQKQLVLPRSPMAGAINYMLNQWQALCRYTEQGYLNIDNNTAERALKCVAIGRKNWLFAGHDEAGQSHARLWTLIASAQRHGLDPQKYLRSVLAKIGQTKLSELNQFLPDVWKSEDAAEMPAETDASSTAADK